jgi:hypothetical protein
MNKIIKIEQTKDELKSHLREQIEFLKRSSQTYDEGYISEAKRLAVAIRLLLHDTQKSTSLLTLLKKKDILFYDTSLDYNPNNFPSTIGLIITKYTITKTGQKSAEYVPPLDDGPPTRYTKGKITFEKWWNKIVFADSKGNKLTRRNLVLAVSNKDGGAHVDHRLDKDYADMTRFNSLGLRFIQNGNKRYFATHPELASVRQISHEILKSLKDEFPEYF